MPIYSNSLRTRALLLCVVVSLVAGGLWFFAGNWPASSGGSGLGSSPRNAVNGPNALSAGEFSAANGSADPFSRATPHSLRSVNHEMVVSFLDDDPETALALLDIFLINPFSTSEEATFLLLRAQILVRMGRTAEAIQDFAEALAVYDQDPELKLKLPGGYASVAHQYSHFLSADKLLLKDALIANDRVLESIPGIDSNLIAIALNNRASLLSRLARPTEAIPSLERLLRDYPSYGTDNGVVFTVRARLAALRDPTKRTPEYIAELSRIAADPDSARFPYSVLNHQELANAYNRAGHQAEATATRLDIIARIDALFLARRQPGSTPLSMMQTNMLNGARITELSQLSGAETYGRRDLAISALERLRDLQQNDRARENIAEQIASMRSRIGSNR